ncbi:unnamed protein product [Orchesella dallaii]|uniref:Major facilitator superfamily (MFS) profile domain-containing protein n=1 Tax=Orchesella dallaii TaxID=48710 RepID=A0ABP1S4P4_9HEXA
MESEPLVTAKNSRMMNYTSEDGSSILSPGVEHDNLTSSGNDKTTDTEKFNYTTLERFHEDALQQVGHGKMQVIIFFVCGFVMAADLAEILALIMSSKSAQFEFCVDDSQRSWLVGATLLGMGVGSMFWGSLGDRVGRRRSLIYCLGVGSIFSGASVTMPTEGTFLTARIFSGFGVGGCMPLVVTYFSEFIQEKRQRVAIAVLFLFWPLGAAYVIMISWFILPSTGFHLSEELKEHFSAWRRLLVAALAPSLMSLIALIFLPEGPLNLMQNGRDAESLGVYKRIHKRNRGSEATFCLSEIEIPSIYTGPPSAPRSVLGDLIRALETLWTSFQTLWTENRRRLTIKLSLIWLLATMGHGAMSSWVISHQASLRDWTFDKDAKMYEKQSLNHSTISLDLVNVRYHDSSFEDFSFSNMIMNHVKFENCTFQRVNFTNVKASYVIFKYSDLSECFFVDTNLGRSNFIESTVQNITYAGLNPECHLIPDFSMYLGNDVMDAGLPVLGIFIGSLISVALIGFCNRSKLIALFLILASFICIGLTIWTYDPVWALVGHAIINVLIAGMWSMLVTIIDKYPFWTRSGALGLSLSAGRIGSFFGVALFGTTMSGIIVPVFSSIFLVLAACIALRSTF